MSSLYHLSFLSNPNIQTLYATPCAGSCGQHRDESGTFLAHKELTLSGEGGRIYIKEAPTVNQRAHRSLITFIHYFIYTKFLSLTTIDIWGQRSFCCEELSCVL